MAGLTVVKDERENAQAAPPASMEWTIRKSLKPGDTFTAAGHVLRVERLIEMRAESNLAAVSVVERIGNAPALRFDGVFSDVTRLEDNAWRGPRK